MSKENPSFLNKVNINLNEIKEDVLQKETQIKNENNQREERRVLEEKQYQNKIELTKKQFKKIGVVDAFNEIIENKFLFISDKPIFKCEPTYNFFGRKNGEKTIEVPNLIPAFITYDIDSISLNVESYFSCSSDRESDNEHFCYLGVKIKENGRYEIGCFSRVSGRLGKEDSFIEIKKTEVNEGLLLNNLSKLVAVYKELHSIQKKVDSGDFHNLSENNLLPHFP